MANVCTASTVKCGDKPRLQVEAVIHVEHERYGSSNTILVRGHRLTVAYNFDGKGVRLPEMLFHDQDSAQTASIVAQALTIGLRAVLVEGVKP